MRIARRSVPPSRQLSYLGPDNARIAEPPDNAALVAVMSAVLDAPSHELELLMKPLLVQLIASTLITEREMSTVDTDEDETFLALFTDAIELHFFEPNASWRTITAADAIKQVARGDYDGLVINPGRRQIELSRDDVIDFFDID